jgi:hypothetical protein
MTCSQTGMAGLTNTMIPPEKPKNPSQQHRKRGPESFKKK